MLVESVIKRALHILPPVKRRLQAMEEMRHTIASQESMLASFDRIIRRSRSPGLFASPDDLLTERLLAHPAPSPLPQVKLVSVPAANHHNRLRIAKRLLEAYYCALGDEKNSPLKREGEDLWTGLEKTELGQLLSILERRNP